MLNTNNSSASILVITKNSTQFVTARHAASEVDKKNFWIQHVDYDVFCF